jgi:hypothetical protein
MRPHQSSEQHEAETRCALPKIQRSHANEARTALAVAWVSFKSALTTGTFTGEPRTHAAALLLKLEHLQALW